MNGIKYYNAKEVLSCLEGPVVICDAAGAEKEYVLTEDEKNSLARQLADEHMNICSMSVRDGKMLLKLVKDDVIPKDLNEEWVKDYVKQNGMEPSFF